MLMRIQKTNEQRAKMACTLVQIMKHSAHASIELRSTIACTFMEMLETSMIEEDTDMIRMINDAIDCLVEEARDLGVPDLRKQLADTIKKANKRVEEKMERVDTGNDILSKVNFNNNMHVSS